MKGEGKIEKEKEINESERKSEETNSMDGWMHGMLDEWMDGQICSIPIFIMLSV